MKTFKESLQVKKDEICSIIELINEFPDLEGTYKNNFWKLRSSLILKEVDILNLGISKSCSCCPDPVMQAYFYIQKNNFTIYYPKKYSIGSILPGYYVENSTDGDYRVIDPFIDWKKSMEKDAIPFRFIFKIEKYLEEHSIVNAVDEELDEKSY